MIPELWAFVSCMPKMRSGDPLTRWVSPTPISPTSWAPKRSARGFGVSRRGRRRRRHRHLAQHELYVVLEGTGRVRVDGELLTLSPHSALLVEPDSLRQVFNDTDADALWLMVGAPVEAANTLADDSRPDRAALPGRPQGATTRTRVSRRDSGVIRFQLLTSGVHCGCGGTGRHAAFRSLCSQGRGGSTPFSRTE